MILSNIVIDDIKSKSGLLFDQAKDFEMLAKLILEGYTTFYRHNHAKKIVGVY